MGFGNNQPQFARNGKVDSVTVTAANTNSDGSGTIGTNIFLVSTADATNGSFYEFLRWIPTATAAGTNTNATVARVFVSTQSSGSTTSANTYLIAEVALPVQSADSSSVAVTPLDIPLNIRLPAGATLLVTNHAAPASSTAWRAVAFGGDY